jgi:uncharacterized protein (TIGR02118 family)
MVRVSFMYPTSPGKRFDHAYYADKHMPLVEQRFKAFGLRRYEVDRGARGGAPGAPAPFVAAAHLYFERVEDFDRALAAHGTELLGDVPNYSEIPPQVQISEIAAG